MTLSHYTPGFGAIIELATDPALDPSYTITARSTWLDTSSSPAVLRERNAANNDWNRSTPLMGEFSITVQSGGPYSDWAGTVSHAEIKSGMRVVMSPDTNGLSEAFFAANPNGPIRNGAFDWTTVSFKRRTIGDIIKVTWLAFYPQV
jgi:hypothetical protein